METGDREALAQFARDRHVHYEVAPEEIPAGEESGVPGFRIRLFATPGESPLQPPGSPKHVELLGELRSFAEQLIRAAEMASRAEIVPTTAAKLYQSTEVPGADEAALTVRIRCDSPEHQRGPDDRCLEDVRARLEAIGVPRR